MRKFNYYLSSALFSQLPSSLVRQIVSFRLATTAKEELTALQDRVSYYNKISKPYSLNQQNHEIQSFRKHCGSTYYFDMLKVIKGFEPELKFNFIHGDVVDVPKEPTFVKSRPIAGDNDNSVLLKLNEIRHYRFVNDTLPYGEKKDMAVWRGSGFRANRRNLLERYFSHPRCNFGRTDREDADQLQYVLPKMSIEEQLKYKFILSLEGKDVATNLKWIMSSNSLVFTPKLRYETWFMEGKLIPGTHYVEINDDFSDLIEKMDYYTAHPEQAEAIIANANQWVEQFKDQRRERLISYLVADQYFTQSQERPSKEETKLSALLGLSPLSRRA